MGIGVGMKGATDMRRHDSLRPGAITTRKRSQKLFVLSVRAAQCIATVLMRRAPHYRLLD